MCKISNELKLCTCNDPEDLENFWELYVYHEEQELLVVGQPFFPALLTVEDLQNRDTILTLLNERNCFDFNYTPKSKDRLLITLKNKNWEPSDYGSEYHFHGFSHNGKKWKHEEYDTFEWMYKHEVEKQGKIEGLYK